MLNKQCGITLFIYIYIYIYIVCVCVCVCSDAMSYTAVQTRLGNYMLSWLCGKINFWVNSPLLILSLA